MVARAPRLLGWLYDATDRPFRKGLVRLKVEQAGARRLLKKIRDFNPDVAICTHFLPTALLDRERRKGRLHLRIATVVTDFEVHGMWLKVPSDHYFVATAESRAHLIDLGIAPGKITVSGIPTHPVFALSKDRLVMRRKHGWREDLPIILVSAGGFGLVNIARLLERLQRDQVPAQIIAICGKSHKLQNAIKKIVARRKGSAIPVISVVGFTTDMDEFMAAADLMIGKPGGLTTSESLIKGLGWVIVNPIPGQEEQNTLYLLEQGVGVWSDNLHTLAFKVRSVLEEPGRLASMRRNATRVARPDASALIAQWAISMGSK